MNEASNEQRSFIGKAIQHLKDFIKGIKRLLRIYGSTDKAVRAAVETPVEQLEFIAQRFEIALQKAAKNKKPATETGGLKASIKKTRTMPYDEQVARAENGTLARSDALYICEAPENLLAIGLSNKPFAMHQGDYRKSRRVSANNKNYSKHGIKVKTVKKLPKTIGDAVMIIDVGDKITVVTSELMTDTKGQPSYVIAGIHKDTKMNTDDVHSVKSLYPLDNFAVRIQKYAVSGQLVITDKNKADELLARVGIQSSERSRIINLAKDTLSQSEADVKQNIVSYDDNGEIIPLSERFNPGKKDIRYSIKSDVDGMSLTDYNNRGWAYGLLNAEDIKLFYEKISETMSPKSKVVVKKLADNTKIFEINNKILFIGGDFDNPVIEFGVALNAESATEAQIIKDICFERLEYGNFKITRLAGWFKTRTAYYGEEYFACYGRENFRASSEQEKRTIKRTSLPDGFASFGYTGESNKRRRSDHDDTGEISGSKFSRQVINSTWDDILNSEEKV